MKRRKFWRATLLVLVMLMVTFTTIFAVKSAATNTLVVNDKVQFTADKYVDAKVEIYINGVLDKTVLFSDILNSDDTQSITLTKIEGAYWLDNTATPANEIDKIAKVKFKITNTSDHSVLKATISRTGSEPNCVITDAPAVPGTKVKDEFFEFEYTFEVDGLHDVAEFNNVYTVTLTAE